MAPVGSVVPGIFCTETTVALLRKFLGAEAKVSSGSVSEIWSYSQAQLSAIKLSSKLASEMSGEVLSP